MNKTRIKEQVCKVLDSYGKHYKKQEITNLVNRWWISKKPLYDVLSKYSNWDDDALAIVLNQEFLREYDKEGVLKAVSRICNLLYSVFGENKTFPSDTEDIKFKLIDGFGGLPPKINDRHAEILRANNVKVNSGQKTSRVLNKAINTLFDLDKLDAEKRAEFNRLYAKASDCYNELRIPRIAIISIHPCDYLMMSNGNSWNSCHELNSSWQAGTISYMGDGVSIIVSVIDPNYEGDKYYEQKKIHRQVFCFQENTLLQSRLYPECRDIDMSSQIRAMMQDVLSTCLGVPNLWVSTKNHCDILYTTHEYGLHYRDYAEEQYNSVFCWLEHSEPIEMEIGSLVYCICCGDAKTGDTEDESTQLGCYSCYDF